MDLQSTNIAILGAGNMGIALLKGLIDGGAAPGNIAITNKYQHESEAVKTDYGVQIAASNREAIDGADLVILALKPQVFGELFAELDGCDRETLFITVAAGVATGTIEAGFGGSPRVVRAMPNTPALVGQGATAIAAGAHASKDDLASAEAVFAKVGTTVIVEEKHLDAVTGLSGSGPAYVMMIVEAFADAGVKVGLPRPTAHALAVQTIRGSIELLTQTGRHPAQLKDQVTSPGGTTISGVHALEQGGLRSTIINAVEAATRRSKELGES